MEAGTSSCKTRSRIQKQNIHKSILKSQVSCKNVSQWLINIKIVFTWEVIVICTSTINEIFFMLNVKSNLYNSVPSKEWIVFYFWNSKM